MGCLVSVIIPTYKRKLDYVSNALQSVLNQTYDDIEIIVVDDSPNDFPYRDEIKNYIEKLNDDRVIYIRNEKNLGGSLSRNVGINASRGEYITFLDDDDEYMPGKVEKQLKFMLSNDCDLSFSNMIMYRLDGKVCDFRDHKGIRSYDNETLLRYHLTKNLSGTPSFMFKADKLKEIGGFKDAKMGQDFFLMLISIEAGLKIRYFDSCDVKVYKHNDGGISQGKNKIDGENMLYEFKKQYFDRLSKKEIRYVKFRHNMVMSVAYKRNHMYNKMIKSMLYALVSSPDFFIAETFAFIKNILRYRY